MLLNYTGKDESQETYDMAWESLFENPELFAGQPQLCGSQQPSANWFDFLSVEGNEPMFEISNYCAGNTPNDTSFMSDMFKSPAGETVDYPDTAPDNNNGSNFGMTFVDESLKFDAGRRASTGGIIDPSLHISDIFNIFNPACDESARRNSAPDFCPTTLLFCPWPGCGKTFNRLYNMRSHYRTHTHEKPYGCRYCQLYFARNHDLKRHERTHSASKPFVCEFCTKAFSRSDALHRHKLTGTCLKKKARRASTNI